MAVIGFASLAGPPASAAPSPCRSVHALGGIWGVQGSGVACGFQRRWARRYLNHARVPAGWSCHGRLFEVGGCHKRHGSASFQFYVQD
jgi:hypothetical protein